MTSLRIVETPPVGENRPATQQEVKRALQVLIGSFPNAAKTDLSIYAVSLFDDVVAERPTIGALSAACRKLRRASSFLPTIKDVLDAIAEADSATIAVPSAETGNLGAAGKYLLKRFGAAVYASWFAKLTVQSDAGETVTLVAPTRFHRDHIAQQFDDGLLQAWQSVRASVLTVRVIVL